MLRLLTLAIILAAGLSAPPFAISSGAEEAAKERFFMVNRIWVPNVRELVNDALTQAHNEHIAGRSVSVTSSRILDRDGNAIGVSSIKSYDSWEVVEDYVYQDPYTLAGLYSDITITELDMYVLNAMFARAPDWYQERFPDRWRNYTVPGTDPPDWVAAAEAE